MVNPAMRSGRAAIYVRMSTEHQQYSLEIRRVFFPENFGQRRRHDSRTHKCTTSNNPLAGRREEHQITVRI
jgi:hypothetical protein